MKKIKLLLLAMSVAAPLFAHTAQAQFAKPEAAISYRQSALTLISSHFGRMQPTIKGATPYDAAAIKANVDLLKTLSILPWAAFPEGSQAGSNAKPEVWSDAAGFKQAQQKFEAAVVKLSDVSGSGDLEKLRAAYGDVGASCKACHDAYRAKK
ncbi:MAG: cytochrome c [Alcaligenaceae bacterium]